MQDQSEVGFFDRKREEPLEIIEGLFREGQIVVYGGGFNVGKTPTLLQMIVCVSAGVPFCGRATLKRPVISVDLENAPANYTSSIQRIAARLNVSVPHVPDDLEPFLELGADANSARLLQTIKSGSESGLSLLGELLGRKPNALVIVDPIDLFFRINSLKKSEILDLYTRFRGVLSTYPHAAFLLVHNLRKKWRSASGQPNLLSDPADWLEEISGSLDIVNRADVRLGIAFVDAERDIRVVHGIRRGEEMHPLLIRPVGDDPSRLAGFEPCDARTTGSKVFTAGQLEYWQALPPLFCFNEVADTVVPRATLSRLLTRAKYAGLIALTGNHWRKVMLEPQAGRVHMSVISR